MYKIIEVESEVGNEILQVVGNGILINVAKWSSPALLIKNIIVNLMPELNVEKLIIIDHDKSHKFQRQFSDNGKAKCNGWCDVFIVKNGIIVNGVHKLQPNKEAVKAWISG